MDLDLNRLQFLGFFAICKRSLRIVFSWRKYGICRISLFYFSVLSLEIFSLSMFLLSFRFTYESEKNSMDFPAILLSHLKSTWFAYLQLILLFSYTYLESLSSAVYSVAWIFSGNERILSHNDIRKIVQSASKRALTTFLWSVAITGSYIIHGGILAFFYLFSNCSRLVGAVILIFYVMGFVYFSSVSHLAQVVSILEDVHGLEAFVRSKTLIRGKLGVASAIFVLGFSCSAMIISILPFLYYFVLKKSLLTSPLELAPFVVVLALGLVGSAVAILFLLVAETLVYFVCRANHDHGFEKSALAGLLTSSIDEGYAPIPSTADAGHAGSVANTSISA